MSDRTHLRRAVTSVALLVDLGRRHGVAAADLLDGSGVHPLALHDPSAEILGAQELIVVANLVRLVDVPELGFLAGEDYHVGTLGAWGLALGGNRTLRDSIEVGLRYIDLTFTFADISLVDRDDEVDVEIDVTDVPEPVRRFLVERDIQAAFSLARELLGFQVVVPALEFTFDEPTTPAHRACYDALAVEVTFGADRIRAPFPAALLALPAPVLDPSLSADAEEHLGILLERRRQLMGTAGRVREALRRQHGVLANAESVAAALGLSARSLRRRLATEGVTFRQVATETTSLLADPLLRSGWTVEETARHLGYSGASSFSRAFKAATGRPPGRVARG